MISIVCVYNNRRILEDYLLKSLENQTAKYELVLLDNTKPLFSSAAEALNLGAKRAASKYIMFVHQDIRLSANSWLYEAERIMDTLPYLGIAGVAGVSERLKAISTNLKQGDPPMPAGSIAVEEPLEAQTLDECLVIIPRSVFNEFKFDSEVCDDWHLYAVDYCLSARRAGYRAFVLPLETYHRSSGYSMSGRYYATLKKVLRKHKGHFPVIYTTIGYWNPSQSVYVNRFNHMLWRTSQLWIRVKRLAKAWAMSLWTKRRA